MGEDLAGRLEREIGVGGEEDYEAEMVRLQRVYGLPADFETRLVALCRRPEDERKAREKISEWYGIRHPSLVGYELLAHLLKHRYLDAVISFNFDELLDQSLDDELGASEYVRVVSERDTRQLQRDPDHPSYVPLYIKMHGTAFEPESLRFTRESYYWTPKPVVDVVEDLLDTENLVVVNVGCRLASFDFQYLLREPRNVSIFHVNPSPLDSAVRSAITDFREGRPDVDLVSCGEDLRANGDFLPKVFARLMAALGRETNASPSPLAYWRPVGRHRAVAELLDVDRLEVGGHLAEYLRQRTVLEVAFAAAKGRGVVSTTALVDERCGRYYDLYVRAARDEGVEPASWATICAAGGLIESNDSADVYYAAQSVCGRGEPAMPRRDDPVTNHKLRRIDPDRLAKHVLAEVDSTKWAPDALSRPLKAQSDHLRRVIDELHSKDELEIHSLDDRVCSKVFVAPLILRTHTAFTAWARKLLVGEDYDEVRVVAETGGWLADDEVKTLLKRLERQQIKVIVAFDIRRAVLRRALSDRIQMQRLPWWRHNRHMRLLCRQGQPVRAIYYARFLRTSMVTPVFLEHGADLKRLDSNWQRLWQEASEYEAHLNGHNQD